MSGLDGLGRDDLEGLNREIGGEKILWAGKPAARVSLVAVAGLWVFAVPWTVFAIGWEVMALSVFFAEGKQAVTGPGVILAYVFPIFGIPFVVIGIGMMAAPFWAAYRARRTVHVLTNKRLLTAMFGRAMTIRTVDPRQVVSMTREEKAGGIGTLRLSLGTYRDSDGDRVEKLESFESVPDVKDLETRLRGVMASLAGA